jgi:hypothetical protein
MRPLADRLWREGRSVVASVAVGRPRPCGPNAGSGLELGSERADARSYERCERSTQRDGQSPQAALATGPVSRPPTAVGHDAPTFTSGAPGAPVELAGALFAVQ